MRSFGTSSSSTSALSTDAATMRCGAFSIVTPAIARGNGASTRAGNSLGNVCVPAAAVGAVTMTMPKATRASSMR